MQQVAARVAREVPTAQVSRDSPGRETDLAFDYNEFARLPPETVRQVLAILQSEGMTTSVSSIHIHGCFGRFDKWLGACWIAQELWGIDLAQQREGWCLWAIPATTRRCSSTSPTAWAWPISNVSCRNWRTGRVMSQRHHAAAVSPNWRVRCFRPGQALPAW